MRIITKSDGVFQLDKEDGYLVRTTACEVFETSDRGRAEEALAYLTQETTGIQKLKGSHWAKSTFGVEFMFYIDGRRLRSDRRW